MNKMISKGSALVLFATIAFGTQSSAQFYNSCGDYHKEFCAKSENKLWKYNGQSRSAPLSKGDVSEFNVIAYGGQDYRISFCVDSQDKIEFQIFEEKKVKVTKEIREVSMEDEYGKCIGCNGEGTDSYGDRCYECDGSGQAPTGNQVEIVSTSSQLAVETQRETLYDNKEDGLSQELEFSMDGTKRLILAVKLPGQAAGGRLKAVDMTCVGVYIENMTTPQHGFN